jgi:mono/diheme cytochrome c family protein
VCWFFGVIGVVQSDETVPGLKDPNMISAGRELCLEKHCSHCHGANGDGGVNLTNRDLSNPNYVFEAIAEGRERGSLRMPGWREVLSEGQCEAAANWDPAPGHHKALI